MRPSKHASNEARRDEVQEVNSLVDEVGQDLEKIGVERECCCAGCEQLFTVYD